MEVKIVNSRSFNRALSQFAKKTEIAPGTVAQKATLEAFKGVVERTPVDTGYARANWNVSEGSPDWSTLPGPFEDQNYQTPPPPSIFLRTKFPTFYVSNAVDYIIELENGHSKQMGKGYMVQRTLVKLESEIRKILRSL